MIVRREASAEMYHTPGLSLKIHHRVILLRRRAFVSITDGRPKARQRLRFIAIKQVKRSIRVVRHDLSDHPRVLRTLECEAKC